MKSSNRYKRWPRFAAVATAVLAALAVTLVVTHKDAESAKTFDAFSDSVVPGKNTSQYLIAPATSQWWKVVASLGGGENGLWGAKIPAGARWVGFSSGLSQAKAGEKALMLSVFYIGFDTNERATRYSAAMGSSGANLGGILRATGNVVEMIPAYANYQDESFALSAPSVTGQVKRAHWYINVTGEMSYLGGTGDDAKHIDKFTRALGISADLSRPTEWTGVSKSVDSGFVGKLTKGAAATDLAVDTQRYLTKKNKGSGSTTIGKKPDFSDAPVSKASAALIDSSTLSCPTEQPTVDVVSCARTDDGLLPMLGTGLTVATAAGGIGLPLTDAEEKKAPTISFRVGSEYDVVGLVVPKVVSSVIAGFYASQNGPLARIEYGYSAKSGNLTLKPILSDAKK